jgi:hypothetical protein
VQDDLGEKIINDVERTTPMPKGNDTNVSTNANNNTNAKVAKRK